jgi:hypothetical protein
VTASVANARTATRKPLRASRRPTNRSRVPSGRSAGSADAKRTVSTPLGTISNVPPIRARSNASARRETAIRTAIRRATPRRIGAARSYSRARRAPEWNVPTTGTLDSRVAHIPVEGVVG